jgi:NAD-dependent dihydropyrimidine dehydrogenase PreA subunit
MGMPIIDYKKCSDCGHCYEICPMDIYARIGKAIYVAFGEECMACFLCELECPKQAIFIDPRRSKRMPFPY